MGFPLSYCEGISLGGHSDWRLPNIKELESLTDDTRYLPAIDTNFFPNAYASYYWSSTTNAYYPDYAWSVPFHLGYVVDRGKYGYYYVRCVRGGQSGSLGDLDHFEFSTISSPKSVGVPFSVTITAKDANGNAVNYSGSVSLWSNAGYDSASPLSVYLVNGQWTGYVTLNSAGGNLYLIGSIIGTTGTSNTFAMNGQLSNFGNLSGEIRNENNQLVQGETQVILTGLNYYDMTVYNGKYQFPLNSIACGNYTGYARFVSNNITSHEYDINIPCDNQRITQKFLISFCNASQKTPVLLLPGIMGTAKDTNSGPYPGLPKDSPAWNSGKLQIHAPKITGWKQLKGILTQTEGYQEGCNLFEVPYDWRMDINDLWDKYLKPWIDYAKSRSGQPKVNIIAHSMGGLLTRAYIQSAEYEDRKDIDKFIMVGTPNTGSTKAYYLWEGGNPLLLDNIVTSNKWDGSISQ